MSDHNASENMLGYLYQVRYALVLFLDTDFPDAQISIEKFDDVAFNNPGSSTPLEMIQMKHHAGVYDLVDTKKADMREGHKYVS